MHTRRHTRVHTLDNCIYVLNKSVGARVFHGQLTPNKHSQIQILEFKKFPPKSKQSLL